MTVQYQSTQNSYSKAVQKYYRTLHSVKKTVAYLAHSKIQLMFMIHNP